MEEPVRLRTLPRRRVAILFGSIALYAATLYIGFSQGFTDIVQTWKGYFTLLVPTTIALDKVQDRLVSAGVHEPLSAASAQVEVSGFGEPVWLPVEVAANRLAPNDVRQTPWIPLAAKLFSDDSRTSHIIYIPRTEALPTLMLKLQTGLAGVEGWQVIEWNPQDRLIMLAFALAVWVIMFIFAKGYRLAFIAAGLPWVLLASGLGPRLFPFTVALLVSFALLSERMIPALRQFVFEAGQRHFFWELVHDPKQARESLRIMKPFFNYPGLIPRLIIFGGLLVLTLAVLLLAGEGESIGGTLLVCLLAWPAIWIWTAYLYAGRLRSYEHSLFLPVPILSRGSAFITRQSAALIPLVVLVAASSLLFAVLARSALSARIPLPVAGLGPSSLDMNQLRAAYHRADDQSLPDMSLYVAHRAWQDALAYRNLRQKQDFDFPDPKTSYSIMKAPTAEGGGVTQETVLKFDDDWLHRVVNDLPETAVARLLSRQGASSGLAYSSKHRVYSADSWSLFGLVILAFQSSLVLVVKRRTAVVWGFQRLFEWGKKSPA